MVKGCLELPAVSKDKDTLSILCNVSVQQVRLAGGQEASIRFERNSDLPYGRTDDDLRADRNG